jgi:glutamyl/glutaminyl-tRNA synthetase
MKMTNKKRDWDDPRLYTLSALRRRGFPPEAINWYFVSTYFVNFTFYLVNWLIVLGFAPKLVSQWLKLK